MYHVISKEVRMNGKGPKWKYHAIKGQRETHDLASKAGAKVWEGEGKKGTGSQWQKKNKEKGQDQSLKTICWP